MFIPEEENFDTLCKVINFLIEELKNLHCEYDKATFAIETLERQNKQLEEVCKQKIEESNN